MSEADELAWEPDDEDRAFLDVYGDWDPLTPTALAGLMTGFPHPWWLVGGHAIEAFTGVRRFHEDIDLVVFTEHVPALREQLGGHFHLWCNAGGTFRILDDEHPDLLDPLCQIWMCENARSPWRIDCILNPEGALLFKAKQARTKDGVDLDNAWPLVTAEQRAWLADAVRRAYPDHVWTDRLSTDAAAD